MEKGASSTTLWHLQDTGRTPACVFITVSSESIYSNSLRIGQLVSTGNKAAAQPPIGIRPATTTKEQEKFSQTNPQSKALPPPEQNLTLQMRSHNLDQDVEGARDHMQKFIKSQDGTIRAKPG